MVLNPARIVAGFRQKANEKRQRCMEWHDWFAWYPVEVYWLDYRWLEIVERKAENSYYISGMRYVPCLTWDYRAKNKVWG